MSGFKKATKKQAKLRAAIFGPSGSGKTFTSLRIASGICPGTMAKVEGQWVDGSRIAVIDTERRTACKYSDRFNFDVLELQEKTIKAYCAAIALAHGYEVLIIDSLSHGWQELLETVEKIAQARYRGNVWSAWSEGTPLQRQLVDAILDFPGHVIATMRSKTEWTTVKNDNGKSAPVRVGLAPEQGKGIEYEFDLLLELSVDHVGNILKDRTGKYQDSIIKEPGEEFGKELAAWLADAPPEPAPIDFNTTPCTVIRVTEKKSPATSDKIEGGQWIAYVSELSDGRKAGTFDKNAAELLEIARGDNKECLVVCGPGQREGSLEIVAITCGELKWRKS